MNLLSLTMFKIFLIICLISGVFPEESPVVTLPLGRLQGLVKKTESGKPFYAFEGVPYAKPPIGKHKFKDPVPLKSWSGVWQANKFYKCLQWSQFYKLFNTQKIDGEEDCLYLNIYTPNLSPNKPYDVIFYIHGGAFMFGFGALQGPDIIMNKDVVFVSINYRLGPLGFLSTEDNILPGNMGLKDQNLALRWVNEYIQYFGGNPESITIMGMSAGGASVQLHYLMPESQGLFQRGFSQSGTALCPWVLMENGLEKTKKLSSLLGCPTNSSRDMIECLRRKPSTQIVGATAHFQPWLYNPFSPFGVVVDKWATNPVLPDHPYVLLKSGQVQDLPWISSYTSAEGLYPASEFYSKEEYLNEINEKWDELMPFILDYNYTVDSNLHATVAKNIRQHYMKEQPLNKKSFSNFVQAISERMFVTDIEKAIRLQSGATKSPVYVYHFSYRGTYSKSELISGKPDNLGVSHADDTSYILSSISMPVLLHENDAKISNFLVEFTTAFASTGNPNVPQWEPISKTNSAEIVYLNISSPVSLNLEKKTSFYDRAFWDSQPFIENEKLVNAFKDEL